MKSDWERRFGAKRRAADKALLAELERSLPTPQEEAREAISRAFGRPPLFATPKRK
jgi:hypothetical protein